MQGFLEFLLAHGGSKFDGVAFDHRFIVNELAFCSLERNIVQLIAQDGGVCAMIGPNPTDGIAGFGKTADEALSNLAMAIEAEQIDSISDCLSGREALPKCNRLGVLRQPTS
jgi:hypothetical protein